MTIRIWLLTVAYTGIFIQINGQGCPAGTLSTNYYCARRNRDCMLQQVNGQRVRGLFFEIFKCFKYEGDFKVMKVLVIKKCTMWLKNCTF
jgi:hypothetical protein